MAEIHISKQQDGATITINTKDTVVVALPEQAGTGYKWVIDKLDGFAIKEKFQPSDSKQPGAEGSATFQLKPMAKTTKVKVQFYLKRSWEKQAKPEDSFSFFIEVE
jgi:predicted secreted protein